MNWILCFYLGLFCFNLFEILIVVYKHAILEKNSYLTHYKLMSFDDDTGYYNKTSYLKRKNSIGSIVKKGLRGYPTFTNKYYFNANRAYVLPKLQC